MSERKKLTKVISIIAAIALLLAIPSIWPYGYYILLRWIVAVAGGFAAWMAYSQERIGVTVLFGFIVLLFNPIAPVHLEKGVWVIIDLITAGVFGWWVFDIQSEKNYVVT